MIVQRIALIGVLSTGLVLAACGSQQSDWQDAQRKNTVQSYQQYLQQYPQGEHVAAANQQIAHIKQQRKKQQARADWKQAQQTDTPQAYQQFLQKHADSQFADKAKQQIQQIHASQAWAEARQSNNPRALKAFVSQYPDSSEATQARRKLARLQQQKRERQKEKEARARQQRKEQQQKQAAAQAKGDYQVQLGAFTQKDTAQKASKQLQSKLSDQLNGASIKVASPSNGSSLYRVKTSGMSHEDASSLCDALRKSGTDCFVTKRRSQPNSGSG